MDGKQAIVCFRAERDRLRARALTSEEGSGHPKASAETLAEPPFTTRAATMTPAQRAHRFRMLTHLRRTGSVR